MDPFDILGLEEPADEATIKRAYARLLKRTRPDTDPAGFQQLHEAYQLALQYSRWQVLPMDAPAESEADAAHAADALLPGEAFEPASARQVRIELQHLLNPAEALPASPAFDLDEFCIEAGQRAEAQTPAEIRQWLQAHDALYRMQLKRDAGAALFERWDDGSQVLRLDRLAVFSEFFDIDDSLLSEKMRVRWAVANDKTDAFGESHPRVVRQLKRPFFWPQALLTALVPSMAARIAALADRLLQLEGRLPAPLDPRQQAFFARIADAGYAGRWRWAVMLSRAFLLGLVAALVIPWAATRPINPLQVGAVTAAVVVAVELAAWLLAWIRLQQRQPRGWRAQVVSLLPVALATLALAIDAFSGAILLAAVLASIGALANWRRAFDALRFMLGGLWMWGAMPGLGAHVSQWVWAMACVPLGLTLFDAYYAHQHGQPLRMAAGNRWTTVASYAFFLSWLAYRYLPLLK